MSVRTHGPRFQRALHSCVAAVEGVAFWTSVLVPLTYPPLLVSVATETLSAWILLAAVGVNAFALVLGHRYNRGGDGGAVGEGAD